MNRFLPAIIGFAVFTLAISVFLLHSKNASALTNHIVISEIQIEGGSTTDEFVELYNPTDSSRDLTGWTLYRKTGSGTEEIVITTASGYIPAHGFYLFANSNFDGGISSDTTYSENISDNNTVILRNASGDLIDLVGLGTSLTNETATINNPIDNRSVERKANSTSTEESMASGGVDELNGNGEDTNNNLQDFVRHVSPNFSNPQNKNSDIEPQPEPTLTPTIEPSVTPTTEPSPSPEPTPTVQPTSTPSPSPTTTPTEEPTPTPTTEPTPTIEPTPTTTPSVTPTPIKNPRIFSKNQLITCTVEYKKIRVFGRTFYFPQISCFRTLR